MDGQTLLAVQLKLILSQSVLIPFSVPGCVLDIWKILIIDYIWSCMEDNDIIFRWMYWQYNFRSLVCVLCVTITNREKILSFFMLFSHFCYFYHSFSAKIQGNVWKLIPKISHHFLPAKISTCPTCDVKLKTDAVNLNTDTDQIWRTRTTGSGMVGKRQKSQEILKLIVLMF